VKLVEPAVSGFESVLGVSILREFLRLFC